MVWPCEGWVPSDLLAPDMLRMNEYLSSFQFRYVDGTCQVFCCVALLRPHPRTNDDDDSVLIFTQDGLSKD